MAEIALSLHGVKKDFAGASGRVSVLKGVDLTLKRGELVALSGPSGAGKSTLLQIAGLLDRPDQGKIILAGQDCTQDGEQLQTEMRLRYIGFVYQFHHLLAELTAQENVALPQRLSGVLAQTAEKRAGQLLADFGLSQRLHHRPGQLSGGERQRVAIARAMVNRPLVLLADEPTGNLDPANARKIFQQFTSYARQKNLTVLVATHNLALAKEADTQYFLQDGRLMLHK